eukprot:SAG11_NODE_1151_length_5668_cov_6.748070_1_plen_330_part_00
MKEPPLLLLLLVAQPGGPGATAVETATVSLRPWGADAIRLQFCSGTCSDQLPGALSTTPPTGSSTVAAAGIAASAAASAVVTSGNLACAVDGEASAARVTCHRVDDGKVLLRQTSLTLPAPISGGAVSFDFSTSAQHVFGMGQNRPAQDEWVYDTRSLDVRNQTFDFEKIMGIEGGATNGAPFVIGGGGDGGFSFGLLFNSPSFGGMKFTETELTCSTAPDNPKGRPIRKELDFLIVTSAAKSPPSQRAFDISSAYTAAVGRTPTMPAWGSLYWHCKNRYSNQTQLLTAARYLHKHVPGKTGVLVIDWFDQLSSRSPPPSPPLQTPHSL